MSRQRGFTLLEALVAVALLAVLGLAAALTLNSSIRSERILGTGIEELQRLQRALHLVRRDLEQVVVRRGRNERGDFREHPLMSGSTGADASEGVLLDFYKGGRRILSPTPPGSHLERVRYRLHQGRLIRDSSPFPDAPNENRWHSAVLLEGVLGVAVDYYIDQQWQDQWPPLAAGAEAAAPALPRALRLTVETERFGPVPQAMLLPDSL